MELRDIEIFLTLAEELHFGRTAERLHVTPSRVSQAIKKQERRVGAALFARSSRHVELTPIGRRLFEDLQPMYLGMREGLDRAARAARGKTQVLRIGMTNANHQDLRPLLDAFEAGRPTCDVNIRHVDFNDPFGPLRTGAVDVQVAWLPVREADLTAGPVVYIEPVVLAVGACHRLAARTSVSYEDLADEVVMGGARPDYWREALVPRRTPSGRLIPIGPIVNNSAEMLPLLSNGEAVSPAHAHAARYFPRPDITYVPIHDAPPARWALIWRTAAQSDLVRDLAHTATRLGPIMSPELTDRAIHP
ncbi:LysR family transcriptional regulator [Nonomuraea sp. PA05]|uniref:LysR family transcriptional regulator n=1 Tax=Nonomuraea sp. PA05 TaxID=2604466 RepID=UPI0011DBDAF4|nr:LysR family transcriptional regulator [Nonomuraea sp. PA05]TYB57419.1 LysR family transcriptional regulator [Nonomuraea sp. PA05]